MQKYKIIGRSENAAGWTLNLARLDAKGNCDANSLAITMAVSREQFEQMHYGQYVVLTVVEE